MKDSLVYRVIRLLRWDKPTGRLILMVPALWSLVLAADGHPPWDLLLVVVLGAVATSAAGCVVNDLWDRRLDAQVQRTRQRPLASGQLSVGLAMVIAAICLLCAYLLARYLNPLAFGLAVLAVPVMLLYPSAKRWCPIPQVILATAWGFAVLIPWAAVTGTLTAATWWLWGAVWCWTLAFDTIYALMDREDDARVGIHSSARFFGRYTPWAVGVLLGLTLALLAQVGRVLHRQWPYYLAMMLTAVVWATQVYRLRRSQPLPVYSRMFQEQVATGFLLLLGMVAS
ncbi:MAG: 4-hydroxybenzoate solanesyltransferase [Gloeomargarita sp. SKYBB_i_bin120]|nr:4-hydroxybenzoate solanesyltransferase [Gloeomargarita sp. SKYB120]MDW8178692.1 4-hydroxybenzoate solanesyltransferase [Gloeomargarita sp. SKYBB_i_bin120]